MKKRTAMSLFLLWTLSACIFTAHAEESSDDAFIVFQEEETSEVSKDLTENDLFPSADMISETFEESLFTDSSEISEAPQSENQLDSGSFMEGSGQYVLYADGTLVLSGPAYLNLPDADLPWSKEQVRALNLSEEIRTIGPNAFADYPNLSSISLPGVTRISEKAFSGCENLESIRFSDTRPFLESLAFENCSSLKTVLLPVDSIEEGVFNGCSNAQIYSVSSFGSLTLVYCGVNTDPVWYVPESIEGLTLDFIEADAFSDLQSQKGYDFMQTLILPKPIPIFVDYDAMFPDKPNVSFSAYTQNPDGSLHLYAYRNCSLYDSLSLPACAGTLPVTTIGSRILSGTGHPGTGTLLSLQIPEGIRSIGEKAFTKNAELMTLSLPSSLTSIGREAFCQCALYSLQIPGNVQTIGSGAFAWNSLLYSVSLQEGIPYVGKSMFENCPRLYELSLPTTIRTIRKRAFFGCSSLTKAVIPDGTEKIGSGAFRSCPNLESIQIPASVTSIGNNLVDKGSKTVIIGTKGSEAERYAKANGLSFISRISPVLTVQKTLTLTVGDSELTPDIQTDSTGRKVFASSDPSVASVSPSGAITAHQPGKTQISVYTKSNDLYKKSKVKTISVTVRPSAVHILYAGSKKAGQLRIQWEPSSGIDGYQICLDTKKDFSSNTEKIRVSASKTSKVLTGLSEGQIYYVRIRPYTLSGQEKIFGSWSSKKSVQITGTANP